ncbi:hypothetical protein A2U01_0064073, partial [Trifolium medium]|nr:hypothetical protein [Trifolium medium]
LVNEVALAKGVNYEDAYLRGRARGFSVEDNDDTLEKREVSLIGLEKTDASSAAATCAG